VRLCKDICSVSVSNTGGHIVVSDYIANSFLIRLLKNMELKYE
jgi:hypothetical protein